MKKAITGVGFTLALAVSFLAGAKYGEQAKEWFSTTWAGIKAKCKKDDDGFESPTK